jgi:hypothetical protein
MQIVTAFIRDWSSFFSFLVAFIAAVTTICIYLLNRRPRLVAYCEFDIIKEYYSDIDYKEAYKQILVVKNIGKTPAVDVRISLTPPQRSGESEYDSDICSVIMPSTTHDIYARQRHKWQNIPSDQYVTVSIRYHDYLRKTLFRKPRKYKEVQKVSWADGQSREITGGISENMKPHPGEAPTIPKSEESD